MKIIVTAVALAFATTAAAQTSPPQPAPQQQSEHHGHASHGQTQAGHASHGQAQPDQHGSHQGHGAMADCCADRDGNGRMDCCEAMARGHDQHGSSDASPPATQPQSPQRD